jgi:hypothetical protein
MEERNVLFGKYEMMERFLGKSTCAATAKELGWNGAKKTVNGNL